MLPHVISAAINIFLLNAVTNFMKSTMTMRVVIMEAMRAVMVVMVDTVDMAVMVADTNMDMRAMNTDTTDIMQGTITNGDTTKEANTQDMVGTTWEDMAVV